MLTHERLARVLAYDSLTGVFTRVLSTPGHRAGTVAGSIDHYGYVIIKIDGKSYKAHRLAWFFVHGEWPPVELDHRDLNKSNNRLLNLRPSTHAQNVKNTTVRRNNKSGYKGVSWCAGKGRWHAQIQVDGRFVHLGFHSTPEDASAAYTRASSEHHGQFGRAA